jgi:hypothetical protein
MLMELTNAQDEAAKALASYGTVEVLGPNDDGSMSVFLDEAERHPEDRTRCYEIVEINEDGGVREEGQTAWHATVELMVEAALERAAEAQYERSFR